MNHLSLILPSSFKAKSSTPVILFSRSISVFWTRSNCVTILSKPTERSPTSVACVFCVTSNCLVPTCSSRPSGEAT